MKLPAQMERYSARHVATYAVLNRVALLAGIGTNAPAYQQNVQGKVSPALQLPSSPSLLKT